tara:strand:- start:2632 stop:3468 length:837 start_codon:yes stop_codon:yes gene_type:complete
MIGEKPGQTDAPSLSKAERDDAVKRTAPPATVVFEAIRLGAEEELSRTNRVLFFSGLAAGLSMGFSFIAEATLRAGLPDVEWQHLVSKLGYSVGFLIVILGRQQLFTENTLTPVLELLHKKTFSVFYHTTRLWAIVLLANFTGTLLFAAVLAMTAVIPESRTAVFGDVAMHAIEGGFSVTLLRAIFAGWLVALMVWLLPAAESARVSVIIIITYLIGIGGFPHIVAGSTEAFYAVFRGLVTPLTVFSEFFVPTLIGNIIGGVSLVAALNYAQTHPKKE